MCAHPMGDAAQGSALMIGRNRRLPAASSQRSLLTRKEPDRDIFTGLWSVDALIAAISPASRLRAHQSVGAESGSNAPGCQC
jgi:hypothetical protein